MTESMQKWGRKYPHAGYGGRFRVWLTQKNSAPYGSYGNGSAMRVSAAGWLYDTLERTRKVARVTADVTHNHPEGIKGAESVAAVIFLAWTGSSKEQIRKYVAEDVCGLSYTSLSFATIFSSQILIRLPSIIFSVGTFVDILLQKSSTGVSSLTGGNASS